MQTIYINGFKATKDDVKELFERVRKGLEQVLDMHITKSNNLSIKTI